MVTVNLMLEYQAARSAMSSSVSGLAMMDICGSWRSPERKAFSCLIR